MSFLFWPSLGLKTSVGQGGGKHYPSKCWTVIREESRQEENQRTYPGVASQAQIPQDNRVPQPAGSMMLRLPHTRFAVSPSLLPTHRHSMHQAQPLPHPRVGSTSECQQTGGNYHHSRCSAGLSLGAPFVFTSLDQPQPRLQLLPPTPIPRSQGTRLYPSHPIPGNRGSRPPRESQHALPLPRGTQNLPN